MKRNSPPTKSRRARTHADVEKNLALIKRFAMNVLIFPQIYLYCVILALNHFFAFQRTTCTSTNVNMNFINKILGLLCLLAWIRRRFQYIGQNAYYEIFWPS